MCMDMRMCMYPFPAYSRNGKYMYRKVSKRRTKSQNLNDSRLVLHLSLPNLLKPCVKQRMKM